MICNLSKFYIDYVKIILLFLFLVISTDTFSQEGFVSAKGKNFISPAGKELFLKGINLGNWLVPEGYMFKFKYASSPRLIYELFNQMIGPDESKIFWKEFRKNYITKDDINFIKQCGFNSVRIPFNYKLFVVDDNPDMLEGEGYNLLDSVINWCKEENIYVILDMHCAPGGQTGDNIDDSFGYPFLYENNESQNLTAAVWKKIAEKYSAEHIIIGYDLLNEPIAHYFDKEKLNPLLEPLYKKITAAIRDVDKNHIIFLGGAQWNSNFSVFESPFDSNLVYTFHKYWTDTTQDVIQDYINFSEKYNVPIWMGESGENTNEWINAFRSLLEKNNISWCFWPYKKLDSERGVLSINKTDDFDAIIEFANNKRASFEDLRNNRPDIEIVRKALKDYLENCKFKNCQINYDFLSSLGLK